ncbi:MAG: ShlB/FhaC/HecB family hemolysin secretion/activation protein [Leptolyngbyaceae cyanobacterium]
MSHSRCCVLSFLTVFLTLTISSSAKAQSSETQAYDFKRSVSEELDTLPNLRYSVAGLYTESIIDTIIESGEATAVNDNGSDSTDDFAFIIRRSEVLSSASNNLTADTTIDLEIQSFVCSQGEDLSTVTDQSIEYNQYESIVVLEYCFSDQSLYARRHEGAKQEEFAAKLDAILTPYLGQTILPEQVKSIQDAITLQYLSSGYVTSRAEAPKVLTNGALLIPVIEGFIQDVRVTSQYSSEYYEEKSEDIGEFSSQVLRDSAPSDISSNTSSPDNYEESRPLGERTPIGNYIRAQLRPVIGDIPTPEDTEVFEFERPVNISDLESYIRLLALEPRFETERTLSVLRAPNEDEAISIKGGSILDITVQELLWDVEASFNNYSPPSVGDFGLDWNATYFTDYGELAINGRLNLDEDTAGSLFSSSDGDIIDDDLLTSWQINYSPPAIRPSLGRFNFRASRDQNDVVQGDFAPFGFRSETERYALSYRHPIIRSLRQELAFEFGFVLEENQTFIGETQPFRVSSGPDDSGISRTSALSFAQEYITRDSNELLLLRSQFNFGLDIFDATSNISSIPDGQFFSWNAQAQFLKTLGNKHTLFTRASLQLTPNSLLPLNQFVMGGARSVRGYRENFRSGDNGMVLSIEDRIDFDLFGSENIKWLDLKIIPFFDAGWVWNNGGNPNQTLDPNFIASLGVGLQANLLESERLRIRLDYGIPLVNKKELDSGLQDQRLHFSIGYNHHFH